VRVDVSTVPRAPVLDAERDVLSGPVDVCVDRPLLSLDRPFTYELDASFSGGVGSLVSVPFHGRAVKGWVLGPSADRPARTLPVTKVLSSVRAFDARMLDLLRWVSERYVAPLSSVITRAVPPRVVSEEEAKLGEAPDSMTPSRVITPSGAAHDDVLLAYRNAPALREAIRGGASGAFRLRPIPELEHATVVASVADALSAGRRALVLVPESSPAPATVDALVDAFGGRVGTFLGGSKRERYRRWLELRSTTHDVIVATRPGVFTPVSNLGLIWLSRESHPGHREDRAPYYHVRDVALERARRDGAVAVLSALSPSAEAAVAVPRELAPVRRAWPIVEVVKPGPEGRAPRLVAALKSVSRVFLYAPIPGYGIAQVCKACGEPAACAACRGLLRAGEGTVTCAVCGAPGRCANCGSRSFGIRRGGAERVEEWASAVARVPARRAKGVARFAPDRPAVIVGGPEAVKDIAPPALDIVGILDADLAGRRPGIGAMERALSTWMEASAWARPAGRVIVQTSKPNDPAVQALVSGNPDRFLRAEIPRRTDAGFPPGAPVFRVTGTADVETALRGLDPMTLLAAPGAGGETVCLLAIDPLEVATFAAAVRELAVRGTVTRVEAEPHL
jgi:primosomal protein N' (replication factor Y) (superfamily II helicase)